MRFFLFITILFSFGDAYSQEFYDIIWDDKRPLAWDDFKQRTPRNTRGMVAETQWTWDWEYFTVDGEQISLPCCYFNPRESWNSIEDGKVLKHEQLHFDIGELFVRKLRKEILDGKKSSLNNSYLNDLFREFFNNCVKEQRKYDKETNHSIREKPQKEWELFVQEQLNEYSRYSIFYLENQR